MDCVTSGCCICFFLVDPPEIIQHPESQSVATGADATFSVKATGDEIEFQWQKDERDINKESRFSFSGAQGTSMLCIQHVRKSDKGRYRCLIKNSIEKSGKPSHEADLSVGKLVFPFHEKVCLYCYTFLISFLQLIPLTLPKI